MALRDQERLVAALDFAVGVHRDQMRKGTQIPYVSHLLQVSGLVLEHGGDVDQAVAGLLHDAMEDGEDVDEAKLRDRFGAEVARMVAACSDTTPGRTGGDKEDWKVRKQRYVDQLRGSDARTRLVAACDKLDNLRSLIADLKADGPKTLERFTGTPPQTRWYYEEVREVLGIELPGRLVEEVDQLLGELRRFIPQAAA